MDNISGSATYSVYTWQILPSMKEFTASTILWVGRRFYYHSPDTILKSDIDEGEAAMTELAYSILGPVVPFCEALVHITQPRSRKAIIITRQPGTPLVELWPSLSDTQRTIVQARLTTLLGRPFRQPYATRTALGGERPHTLCGTRSEWDTSRVDALRAPDVELETDIQELESVQRNTIGGPLIDTPILTHGDISGRNILVDPETFEITGLIDWEMANIAPAYFEYAQTRLSGGHDPEWRKVILNILREVLRVECEREAARVHGTAGPQFRKESERLIVETLSAWNALVNVERFAQGYSNRCYWTFEEDRQTLLG